MEEDTNIISEPSKKATASTVNPFDPTDSMIRLPDWPTTPFDSINKNEISAIYAQMEILKEDLKKKDEKIEQLQQHILTLETEPQQSKKKRRLSNDELEKQVSDSKDEKNVAYKKKSKN